MKYREAIAQTTVDLMEADPRIVILGAGVTDPKGIFGTTLLARQRFPDRVIETPLSENMLTGALAGLASNGYKPIYVHARSEFALLGMEHLVNTIAKWPWLHGGQQLPIVIRMLVGRGWGQGPTHSQAFPAMFASVPGLMVRYPVYPGTVGSHLAHAVKRGLPTLFIEPRRMYEQADLMEFENRGADVRIVTIGDCILDAKQAVEEMMGRVKVTIDAYEDFSKPLHMLGMPTLVVDSMPVRFGAAAELMAGLIELGCPRVARLGAQFTPCPTAPGLESQWYPSVEDIKLAIYKLLGRNVSPPPRSLPLPPDYARKAVISLFDRNRQKEPF